MTEAYRRVVVARKTGKRPACIGAASEGTGFDLPSLP